MLLNLVVKNRKHFFVVVICVITTRWQDLPLVVSVQTCLIFPVSSFFFLLLKYV